MKRIIRLAPQVPAWCNAENNIYLSSNGKRAKELKEGCDMKAIEKAMRLAPYFDMYLEQAEKVLRKPRKYFTDDEKDKCMNEFMDIYEGANRMLDKCLIF